MSKAKEYYVAMGNDLIQKTQWNLTTLESKLMLYMVSKIKPDDAPFTEYPFTVNEFIKFCGMNSSGRTYVYVKEALVELKSNPLVIHISEKRELITSWFNDADIDKETGEIKITFSPKLVPYLFRLQQKYTQFLLEYVAGMKSTYSIKLYAYLHSVKYKGKIVEIGLEELKKEIECDKYPTYKDFRRYVLDAAVEEINEKTDLIVKYEPIKCKAKVVGIQFSILARENDSSLPY